MSTGDATSSPRPLLEVTDLTVHFTSKKPGLLSHGKQVVRAVDGVSFQLARGETLGLVGESGCGKSTTGRAVLQLLRPTAGSVRFDGIELTSLWRTRFGSPGWSEELRALRKRMQMIFQDPYASLNPRMTVEDLIGEPLRTFDLARGAALRTQVADLLTAVGMDPRYAKRYPHEFSGGQRQRIGIARAIALAPDLIVCDEPISALDVSVQAQVLNLLAALKRDLRLTYVFIAHDLAVVRHIADRIAVMYLGRIVEVAERDALCRKPLHPYTQSLIAAVPVPDPEVEKRRVHLRVHGELPSPLRPPPGCAFHPRCPIAIERCKHETPALRVLEQRAADGSLRSAACHRVEESEPPSSSSR